MTFLRRWGPALALLLLFWLTRLWALEALPLHNDEGLHLTRAVEVWRLHPFWAISDGKIINHWAIALFYPQQAPVFAGRVATIFLGLIGLAAGYALLRKTFGWKAALLSAAAWIACPYLFFYERLAFSDAEAGALVVLTTWAALRLAWHGGYRRALGTGVALALAALFKFTAVPFAFIPLLLILTLSRESLNKRIQYLGIIAVTVMACFTVPIAYLLLRGRDLFSIALGWLGAGAGGGNAGVLANLGRLWGQLTGFVLPIWALFLVAGLVLLFVKGSRTGRILGVAWLVPLLAIILLGSEVLSRHFVVALPLALILSGAGLTYALKNLVPAAQRTATIAVSALLLISVIPHLWGSYTNPGELVLPTIMRTQYITDHSSGYGLREAVQALPSLVPENSTVIASMFPDSCHRANFYAVPNFALTCTEASGRSEIEAALASGQSVYVLADNAPNIGIDVMVLEVDAERVAAFPRPGERDAEASVVLWRLTPQQ